MNFVERLEKTMLAITFDEIGKHEWALKILTKLDEESLHTRQAPAAKLQVIGLLLQSLCSPPLADIIPPQIRPGCDGNINDCHQVQ